MIIYNLLFYAFSTLLILSAIGVVSVKNSVYSVLLLIFSFFNAAALFVLLGAEFIAMSLVIVYVGAVAVLFLFVVMMLDINSKDKKNIKVNRKLLMFVGLILLAEIIAIIYTSLHSDTVLVKAQVPLTVDGIKDNTAQIGEVLYTKYSYLFQVCGIILFVAIISAIILTFRGTRGVRKQDVNSQLCRNKSNSVKIVAVKAGEGVNAIIK